MRFEGSRRFVFHEDWSSARALLELVIEVIRRHKSGVITFMAAMVLQFGLYFYFQLYLGLFVQGVGVLGFKDVIVVLIVLSLMLYGVVLLRILLVTYLSFEGQSIVEHESFKRLKHARGDLLDTVASGQVSSLFARDYRLFSYFFEQSFFVLSMFIVCVVLLSFVFWLSWVTGVILVMIGCGLFLGVYLVMKYNRELMRSILDLYQGVVHEYSEGVNVSSMLNEYHRVNWFHERIVRHLKRLRLKVFEREFTYGSLFLWGVLDTVQYVIVFAGLFSLVYFSRLVSAALVFGVTFLLWYVVRLLVALINFPMFFAMMEGVIDRNRFLLSLPEEQMKPRRFSIPKPPNAINEERSEPVILECRHVGFSYKEIPVLRDFSAKFHAGELIIVSGVSGIGKSTLFKLLTRYYEPVVGSILVKGRHAYEWDRFAYRREFGVAFQDFVFVSGTLRDNLVFGREIKNSTIIECISWFNLEELFSSFTDGLNTIIDASLSSSQKEFISFVRAVISDYSILLLDEPFASVSHEFRLQVLLRLRVLLQKKGKIGLVITHDQGLATIGDQVVSLSN